MGKVTSLLNARHTFARDDELVVGRLFEQLPTATRELQTLKANTLRSPFYRNYLISRDGGYTVLDIEPVTVTRNAGDVRGIDGTVADLHLISTAEYNAMMAALAPILDRFACRRYLVILTIGGLLRAGALGGAIQVGLSHNPIEWFPKDSAMCRHSKAPDAEMAARSHWKSSFDRTG